MTRFRHVAYRIARWAFFIASLAYLAVFAQRAMQDTQVSMPDLLRASAGETAAATLVFALAAVGSVVGWHALLQHLAGVRLSRRGIVQLFCTTQIAKYLPGNVGHHIGRVALARTQLGVPAMTTALSLLQEGALVVAAALLVGTACVFAAPLALPLPAGLPAGPLLLGVLVLGFGTLALVRHQGDRVGPDAPRWLAWLSRAAPGWPALRVALPAYVGIHVANGIAVACIASATLPINAVDLALLTGAYALAWMVGFLLPGAPGGLGVRESAFLMLIAPAWPADVAFGIAMLARVANVAADAAIFGAGLVLAGKTGREAAPNDL